jgi:hypothetical protein
LIGLFEKLQHKELSEDSLLGEYNDRKRIHNKTL